MTKKMETWLEARESGYEAGIYALRDELLKRCPYTAGIIMAMANQLIRKRQKGVGKKGEE